MKKLKVYMGQPSTGTVVDFQAYVLRDIAERYKDRLEFVYPAACAHRIFHDAARNGIVEDFLATDCDVLWFLDSDVVPAPHVAELLTLHWDKWKCAGAPYPIFMHHSGEAERQIVFTAYKNVDGTGLRPSRIPNEGQEFVDGLATGCLFIKREVFSQLQKPYFEFKYDPVTRAPVEGEDLGFCLKAAKLGIQFYTDYSMVCKHYKNVELLEMNDYAISYAKKAIDAYDRDIRENVLPLLAARREQTKPALSIPTTKLVLPGYGGGSST